MAELSIRRATPEDESAIIELQRSSLGEGVVPRTADFWRWKHVANPFGPSPVLVAEANNGLVGLRSFMRWTWQTGHGEARAVRAVDTATHPDWRGQGIFTRLTVRLREEVQAEGVAFIFNTPNEKSRPGYLKMGWHVVGQPTLWLRPVRPLRLAATLAREGLGGGEAAPPVVDAEPAADTLARPGVVALLECMPGAGAAAATGYHTRPTLDFLRWRYADIPGLEYFGLSAGSGEDGVLVLMRSRQRGDLRELRICDIVVGPTAAARRSARSLLREAPRRADVDVAVVAPPPGGGLRLLPGAGYLPAPRSGPILTAYPLAIGPLPAPIRLGNWAPSVGDLELF